MELLETPQEFITMCRFNFLPLQGVAFLITLQDLVPGHPFHPLPLPHPNGRGSLGAPLLEVGLPSQPSALWTPLWGSCPALVMLTCHGGLLSCLLGDSSWFISSLFSE